ncbi:MAG: aminotransferase class III-fold pyridoxal phosphate-dependent enzyme, partial [candidate division Zixibacteria bacterium]|nr:aminotransferase class III-fold pyridoxal phosphate-dependent enzyme [candidate division Zixibacteria bacterium]
LLGRMDSVLTGFSHPAARREFYWDLAGAVETIKSLQSNLQSPRKKELIDYYLSLYSEVVRPHLSHLRKSVIHNDANDNNILTGLVEDKATGLSFRRTTGLIDFGDAVFSHTINNLAVAVAYAMLDVDDPLHDAGFLVAGYHQRMPLDDSEFAVLFVLACVRLCLSVSICAYQQKLEPENEYLKVSEQPGWALLERACRIGPHFAGCYLRNACDYPPCLESDGAVGWLKPYSRRRDDKSHDRILSERESLIGSSLSVAYREPLKIVRGYLQYLCDDKGLRYLDAVNNVPHVGHCHPKVVAAGQKQMALLNTNTRYLHAYLTEYAARLTATLPGDLSVCYFVCSGSEANELAIRLAQAHTGGSEFVVIDGAYHGNTGLLVNLSPYKFDGPGGSGAPGFVHKVPTPDCFRGEYRGHGIDLARKYADHIKDEVAEIVSGGKKTAAMLAESVMGCAGQIVFPDGYLKEAYEQVRAAGGVCIADEVQIGFGRIGSHFWAFETQDVIPDIVTLGKPIGNGHPLGAVVTTPEIAASFDNGMEYFNTFGGNPVSCAIGMAVLDVIEQERLQENAQKVGSYLKERLAELMDRFEVVGDVRGLGLFIGVELVVDRETLKPATSLAALVIEKMKDAGVLLSSDGPDENVIKIKPPILFNYDNADRLVDSLAKTLDGAC